MTDLCGIALRMDWVESERDLVALSLALGARSVAGWSAQEDRLALRGPSLPDSLVRACRNEILGHGDPLGEAFCHLRSPALRRPQGAVYTPPALVKAMLAWSKTMGVPARIVDPGTGSGRFLCAAGLLFPGASLLGAEIDPLAALLARANLAVLGLGPRARVECADYREMALSPVEGATLFVGNPPYVRHHQIPPVWKRWLIQTAAARKLDASQLAGLHVYFFLATAEKAKVGDWGTFVTSAEWLDVNYGRLVRQLFLGDLGGCGLHVVEPTAAPFPDTATTAAVACFTVGKKVKTIRLRRIGRIQDLGELDGGRPVRRERLEAAARWTPLTRASRKGPTGYVELGELCRVHRGQVTGSNAVWVARGAVPDLPESVLLPSVTKARELFEAEGVLQDLTPLKRVIDLPVELDSFRGDEFQKIERFLKSAKLMGAHESYTAKARKAWWAVGLREAAPILATYMARRPPAFVRNPAGARHINIAHGLYPREPMSERALEGLATHLNIYTRVESGRTYAGGLTKFEPREMERLFVPEPKLLEQGIALRAAP